ncbi:Zn-ribbon domain-containing OB-fold protein [Haloparvum sedimenti]|uniref:Zn-ribbon domain-containing OB-fold protein n=1 Tax=Haloparvum sedimenti TaxID=1678448 RepID=UPI000B2467AB|nr:OB-fold domain-containing protein [Haloparvum sedimenti]
MSDRVTNTGYDEWLDALAAGEGFYLESPEGHGSLPPRRVCPHSGSTDLSEEPLPDVGAVETFTVVHVAPPSFAGEAPYVTAVADFGPVRITGVLVDVEPADEEIPVGLEVEVDVATHGEDDERAVVLRPV